ncbi:MAG: flagellar basal-body protein FlbY [Maricaulaceae bacterium]|jgi:hypothetical protein
MSLEARDSADRAEQLILLTKRLTDLIERETELFRARRPLEAAPFRDEKAKLANIYRQETARISREPALIADAPEALRKQLSETTEAFHAALDAHGQAIATLQELSEGLVKSIADYVAQSRMAETGYGPGAKLAPNRAGAAITLDQSA